MALSYLARYVGHDCGGHELQRPIFVPESGMMLGGEGKFGSRNTLTTTDSVCELGPCLGKTLTTIRYIFTLLKYIKAFLQKLMVQVTYMLIDILDYVHDKQYR